MYANASGLDPRSHAAESRPFHRHTSVLSVGTSAAVGTGEAVDVGVAVGVGAAVGVAIDVCVGVGVGVGVVVGVGEAVWSVLPSAQVCRLAPE